MKLKYHQATYDLITQDKIDPSDFIAEIEEDAQAIISSFEEGSERQKAVIVEREYHQTKMLAWTNLDLYQRPVQFSHENMQKLHEIENKYNVKLPASVREWYSLDILPEIMALRSFFYYKIEQLKPDEDGNWHFVHWEYIGQGGETLCFRTDEGDNPPVYPIGYESWVIGDSFSEFIHGHFWDWHTEYIYPYTFSMRSYPPPAPLPLQIASRFHVHRSKFDKNFNNLIHNRYFNDDDSLRMYVNNECILDDNMNLIEVTDMVSSGTFYSKSAQVLEDCIYTIWDEITPPLSHMNTPLVYADMYYDEMQEMFEKLERKHIFDALEMKQDWIDVDSMIAMFLSVEHLSNFEFSESIFDWLLTHPDIERHPENNDENIRGNRFRLRS
ncbi:MAG: SMI1/KNR4 family protein [Chloroflexota bacterium]